MGQAYVSFTRNSTEQIRSKVIDELWILNFFEVILFIRLIKLNNFCLLMHEILINSMHKDVMFFININNSL
jgi:hypothetical protein